MKKKITGERLVNLFLLLVSMFYLVYSRNHYKLGTIRMPKEGFMPMLAGTGAVIVSAILTVQSFLGKGDAAGVKIEISWKRFALLVAISLLYALLLTRIGYLVGSFLFLLAVLKIAGVDGIKKPLLISLIAASAFYFIFKFALGVMLPAGLLGL